MEVDAQVARLVAAARLKRVDRAGWVRVGVVAPESVAAHSWGVSLLVVLLAPPELDRARALTYAALHDLAEAWVGDLTPFDGVARDEKLARERDAISRWTGGWPGAEGARSAWEAYEAQRDPEARFVRQLDRLDMAVQALAYTGEVPAERLTEFVASAAAGIDHPALAPLVAEIARAVGQAGATS